VPLAAWTSLGVKAEHLHYSSEKRHQAAGLNAVLHSLYNNIPIHSIMSYASFYQQAVCNLANYCIVSKQPNNFPQARGQIR
jgi:hypothetical protein